MFAHDKNLLSGASNSETVSWISSQIFENTNVTISPASKTSGVFSKIMGENEISVERQLNCPSNVMISKDISVTPIINNEENEIMSLLKKLPHITVFKVPESPKPDHKPNMFFEKNVLVNKRENIINKTKVSNGNLKKNSNIKPTLKRKQNDSYTTTMLKNNVGEIPKNLDATPGKYPREKNNLRTSSPNVKKIKKSETFSKKRFTNLILTKPKTENNIEIKPNKLIANKHVEIMDSPTMDPKNIVPPCQTLDSTNITDTEYISFVMGLDNFEHSSMHLKVDQNNKEDNVVEDSVVVENKKFCDDSVKLNNEIENYVNNN